MRACKWKQGDVMRAIALREFGPPERIEPAELRASTPGRSDAHA
jgi:hypothetical protein